MDVSPRVDGPDGVRDRRADEGDLAGEVTSRHRRRVEADEDRDADEADGEAGEPVDRDPLVAQEERGDDDDEQRDGAVRIAARAESTVSSAHVISENGIAMLTAPMTIRWP